MSSRREISDLLIPWRNSFADFGGFNRRRGGSTETRAALPGVVQSGTNAFTEDVAFELRKDCQHTGHRSASGCGQIKRFAYRHKANVEVGELLQRGHQI